MSKNFSDVTLYDRIIRKFKNNKIIAVSLILLVGYFILTKFLDSTVKNVDNINKLLDSKNKYPSSLQPTSTSSDLDKGDRNDRQIEQKKFSFFLVLNSDQIDSKIKVNSEPAKIISGNNTVYQEIEISELNKKYKIELINNNFTCTKLSFITLNHQKVYPCD